MQTRLWNAKLEIQKCNLKVSKLEPQVLGPRIKINFKIEDFEMEDFEFEDIESKGSLKVH